MHRLLIDCPDEPGLIHKITGVLFRQGFNIISNHEFVDSTTSHFIMRTEFSGTESIDRVLGDLREALPRTADIRHAPAGRRPIVIMVTREPHCLGDLLLRHAYEELPARICAVIGNHDTLGPLVERFGIPFHCVSHQQRARAQHEAEIIALLEQYAPDYVVLAKYMRILSPEFVDRYKHRLINIHHSFLPAFAGAHPYQQAFERGVKIIGATAHVVTADLDAGPIIAQGVLPVDHTYTAAGMTQAGRDVEKAVLAKAVKLMLEERVFLHHNRAIIFE